MPDGIEPRATTTPPSEALHYASAATSAGSGVGWLRFGAWIFAPLGFATAAAFAGGAKANAFWAQHAYPLLAANPSAFGREIAPQTIELLRDTRAVWGAVALMAAAAVLRAALAAYLAAGVGVRAVDRNDALGRLARYARFQAAFAVTAAGVVFYGALVCGNYVTAATRHAGVGKDSPLVSATIALLVELLPAWWAWSPGGGGRTASPANRS
jgi:hypothetical protein